MYPAHRPGPTRRLGVAAMAAALLFGAVACGAGESEPEDPTDVNVESDDLLPPGTQNQLEGSSGGSSGGGGTSGGDDMDDDAMLQDADDDGY